MPVERPTTIADVARTAGVSSALVSFALNERPGVAPATRARILQVAVDLGYRANPAARSLRTGRSGTFGLVLRNYTNPYFLEVTAGAQRRALDGGCTVLVVDSDYSGEREHEHVARLAATQADGLAIAPVGDGASITQWCAQRPGTPVVAINSTSRVHDDVLRVTPDNRQAVALAVQHLLDLGHRRIAFITAPASVVADRDRLETFAELADAQSFDGQLLETPLTLPETRAGVAAALADPAPPTAIIANSDHTAHAVYLAARDTGAVVGRDLSVVGHDDLPTSQLLDPSLTTVAVDRWQIGRAIADRLLGDASDDYVAPVSLVVRASTGPPA